MSSKTPAARAEQHGAAGSRPGPLHGWWAAVVPFLMDVALGICFVSFPRTGQRFGAGALELGILGGAPQVVLVATCIFFASASDRWGRQRVLILGACLYATAFALAWAAASLPALILAAVVMGAAGGIFWPAIEAAVADAFGHGLGRGLLLFNLGWTSGLMVGSWAGGKLVDLGPSLPFIAQFCVVVTALALLLIWPPQAGHHAGEEHEGAAPVPLATADLFLLLARIANFGSFFGVAILRSLFAPLGTQLHFSGNLMGVLLAGVSLAQAVSFALLSRSQRWQYRLTPLVAAQAVAILALLGIFAASSPWTLGLCFAAAGCACGVTYTASLFYSLNRPSDRGKMGAIHEAILGSGAMAGPLLGGAVANHAGYRAPYVLAAGVALLAVAVQVQRRAAGRKT